MKTIVISNQKQVEAVCKADVSGEAAEKKSINTLDQIISENK